MTERTLVMCGCGVVRNDEDESADLITLKGFIHRTVRSEEFEDRFEAPRICRGCGCVYRLRKPQAPL